MSLSATDIKVIALTYQLEKEKVGTDHLKQAPLIAKTLPAGKSEPLSHPKSVAGFYLPEGDEDEDENEIKESNLSSSESDEDDSESEEYQTAQFGGEEQQEPLDLAEKFKSLNCNVEDLKLEEGDNVDDILAPVNQEYDESSEEQNCDDDEENDDDEEEDDDDGWITPSEFFIFYFYYFD